MLLYENDFHKKAFTSDPQFSHSPENVCIVLHEFLGIGRMPATG